MAIPMNIKKWIRIYKKNEEKDKKKEVIWVWWSSVVSVYKAPVEVSNVSYLQFNKKQRPLHPIFERAFVYK